MESTLHRQLKQLYCPEGAATEVRVGRYRVDIVDGRRLIEIQCSSLASIRDKVRRLLEDYDVEIIKPLVCRKRLIKMRGRDGPVTNRRWSPKRGATTDVFHELVHFTSVFPHRRLTLRTLLVEIEELRIPAVRQRYRRWRRRAFTVLDQRLLAIHADQVFRRKSDLLRLLPETLPQPFDTRQLADSLQVDRWVAQRIAYCLRQIQATRVIGKRGNALLYQMAKANQMAKASANRRAAA